MGCDRRKPALYCREGTGQGLSTPHYMFGRLQLYPPCLPWHLSRNRSLISVKSVRSTRKSIEGNPDLNLYHFPAAHNALLPVSTQNPSEEPWRALHHLFSSQCWGWRCIKRKIHSHTVICPSCCNEVSRLEGFNNCSVCTPHSGSRRSEVKVLAR